MTKERTTVSWRVVAGPRRFHHLAFSSPCAFITLVGRFGAATIFYETVALSFVIPSEAEGSAVQRTFREQAA
jgi:hypothetical protein